MPCPECKGTHITTKSWSIPGMKRAVTMNICQWCGLEWRQGSKRRRI